MLFEKVVEAAKTLETAFEGDRGNAVVSFFQKTDGCFQTVNVDKFRKRHVKGVPEVPGSIVVIISQFSCDVGKGNVFCMVFPDISVDDSNGFRLDLPAVDHIDLI